MHLIRRAAFRAAASPAVSARSLSTRATISPFRIAATQSKLTSITFRRFASDDVTARAAEEAQTETEGGEYAPASVEEHLQDHVSQAVGSAAGGYGGAAVGGGYRGGEPAATRGVRPELPPNNSIYVGNLQFDVTEADLRREFAEYGNLQSAVLATEPRGLSKGFGYVSYDTVEAATAAIEARNQTVYEGRRMIVNYQGKSSRPVGAKNPPGKTLFIGNLAFEMSDVDLNKLFRDIRNVIDVRVAIDRRTGQPRGFAHADFTDVESAEKALAFLQDKEVYGRSLRVDYSASKTPRLGGSEGGRGSRGEYGNDNGRPSF